MYNKVLKISLDGWKVIYFKGKKYAEGHRIAENKLIRLGMSIQEAGINMSDILIVYLENHNVSDESLLWDWSENYDDLNEEVKETIEDMCEIWDIE
jgi:hypothetical protein